MINQINHVPLPDSLSRSQKMVGAEYQVIVGPRLPDYAGLSDDLDLVEVPEVLRAIQAPHHHQDSVFIDSVLSHLPDDMQKPVAKKYASIYGDGKQYNGEKRRNANQFLLSVDGNRKAGKARILMPERDAICKKADRLAKEASKRVSRGGYAFAVQLLQSYQLPEPTALDNHVAGKIARVCCPEWWARQLTKQSERDTEHFAIKSGFVRRGVSPYISTALLKHFEAKQKASIEALERMEAVNTETGEAIDLMTVLKGSVANPEIRRTELMVRCRGFEDYAEKHGHVAAFYTITAPSKYHATSWNSTTKKAYDNKKFSGVSPRDTQAYLVSVWARIRSKLKRDGLNVYGFRVCEPHHDGSPHWHLLLFMNPAIQKTVTRIMKAYALAEDGNERGAEKHRFTVELIDTSKGSATGYIAKYISKNINGFGIGEDHESGMDASLGAERVRAWASLWGIRQFQMIGGATVGVWRELRRVDNAPDGLLDEARQAADSGDWMQYLILQGGADANRKDQPIKCYTVERTNSETGEQLTNRYGETVGKVEGVCLTDLLGNTSKLETRVHEWVIQQKANDQSGSDEDYRRVKEKRAAGEYVHVKGVSETKEEREADIKRILLAVASRQLRERDDVSFSFDCKSAAPRSSVNNCTQRSFDLMGDLEKRGVFSGSLEVSA